MARQRLMLRKQEPIVIETPLGLIKIHWAGRRSQPLLDIELPGDLQAHIGEERAWRGARFIEKTAHGVKPLYELLRPVKDDDGNLTNLEPTELLRL